MYLVSYATAAPEARDGEAADTMEYYGSEEEALDRARRLLATGLHRSVTVSDSSGRVVSLVSRPHAPQRSTQAMRSTLVEPGVPNGTPAVITTR